jgi:hypothetical protein
MRNYVHLLKYVAQFIRQQAQVHRRSESAQLARDPSRLDNTYVRMNGTTRDCRRPLRSNADRICREREGNAAQPDGEAPRVPLLPDTFVRLDTRTGDNGIGGPRRGRLKRSVARYGHIWNKKGDWSSGRCTKSLTLRRIGENPSEQFVAHLQTA